MNTDIKSEEFKLFCKTLFECALKDVNDLIRFNWMLTESDDVSVESFQRYIICNHPKIRQSGSVELLSMSLYKKAINDIAFQAGINDFLLREIPIATQKASCARAIKHLQSLKNATDSREVG